MSHAARNRAARGRRQPYAWLGVGAVTLGMGAAMVGGTAVAFADTGNDSAGASSTSENAGNDTRSDAPRQRAQRAGAVAGPSATGASAPATRGRVSSAVTTADETPDVTPDLPVTPEATPAPVSNSVAVEGNSPLAAAAATAAPTRAHDSAPVVSAPVKTVDLPAVDTASSVSVPAPAADTAPAVDNAPAVAPAAAVPGAAADPAPNMESWLPVTPIVPGAKVKLALQQIEQAQALLTQETWGTGNILTGIGSLGPQAALASAQLALAIWGSTIANAQAFVKNTAGMPLIHWIAQANLQSELIWPKVSDLSMATASALMTPLGWIGANVAPAQETVALARENGKIYAQVQISMVAGTEPVVKAKINGGSNTKLLVDTGASGLVTTRDKVGSADLGPIIGGGNSCFSGGICYHYDTYNTTVDLGDGAVTTAPVNIVTDNAEYPDSVATFKDFFSWGADGILGVGANTAGPGPVAIPTALMPGELSDGLLIYQNAYPFGLGGYMILGPNLFPTSVSLPGAPDAYVKVSVNGGAKQDAAAIIDSGGVYGTLNRNLYPGSPAGSDVPAGTRIDVYSPDGATLLYSYKTQSAPANTPFIDSGLFNTGNAPYAQNPIYLNYGATPYGIGSTDFSIA